MCTFTHIYKLSPISLSLSPYFVSSTLILLTILIREYVFVKYLRVSYVFRKAAGVYREYAFVSTTSCLSISPYLRTRMTGYSNATCVYTYV